MKILAVDYGTKHIGLAVSNARETMALPFGILENDKKLLNNLTRIVKEEGVGKIVVGTPDYNTQTPLYQEIQQFIAALASSLAIPVVSQDELLTSGWGKQKNRHDLAACRILEPYLAIHCCG